MAAVVSNTHVVRQQNSLGAVLQRPAVTLKGAPACQRPTLARASDRPRDSSRQNRVVEQTRTYDESEGKLYSKAAPPEDDEGSIALLVPGGRVSDRPSQAGGAAAAARREQSKPLKINTDLRLYRARQKGIQARMLPASNGKLQKAQQVEQELRSVLATDPTDERTYVVLGTLLLRQRRIEEARAVYEEGCAIAEGKNAYIWTAMANLERKEGNYAPARKFYQAAVTANSQHAAAYHGWGELEKRAGRLDAARNVLLQGVRQTADDPSPHLYVSLANLAIRTGLVGEARYWLREGTNTQRGAKSNALWTTWGNLEWKQAGDPEAAAYCFDMALRVHRASRYAHLSYAMMEKATGNLRHARELLQAGSRVNPTDAPLRQAYGVMLSEDGEYNGARAQFRAAASADEFHLPVWQAWAVMECKLKNYDRARRLFQRGVWAAPKDPNLVWLWQAWGCMEAELGNLSQARGLFKAGIGLAPTNDACWQAWIKMEEDNDLLGRANALRSHCFEAAERDALPESFTTLPTEGGPVISTVKKWMQRFMQPEAPSTVYMPPPGKSQSDADADTPSSGESADATLSADASARRWRRKSIAMQTVESADAAAAGTGAAAPGAAAAPPGPQGAGAAVGVAEGGRAAPAAAAAAVAHRNGAAAAEAAADSGVGGRGERGPDGSVAADAAAAPEGGLRKPLRRGSKAISGRIERPRRRRPALEGESSTAAQGGGESDSSSAAPAGNGGWTGRWSGAGGGEAAPAEGLDMPEVELDVAAEDGNGSASGGGAGPGEDERRATTKGSTAEAGGGRAAVR